MYAEVVLPVGVDRPFTYAVPEMLQERCAIGMRAVVPWRNRVKTGYIVGLSETTDVEKVKVIKELPDDGPIFSKDMMELSRWIADYYCCAWGEALQCAVPSGINLKSKVRYLLREENIHNGRFTDSQKAIVAAVYKRGALTQGQLAREVGGRGLASSIQALVRRGVLVEEQEEARATVSAHLVSYVALDPNHIPDNEYIANLQRRAPRQAALYLDLLHHEPERATSQLYERHRVGSQTLRSLEDKDLIRRFEREVMRTPDIAADERLKHKFELNEDQRAAYAAMTGAMDRNEFRTFLLRGITGSGKTEVYLQAIEHALEMGKSAIILVPEISLTPQTVGRFKGRFAEDIAVLHSGLSAGERYDEWRRAQRGDVRIVVGARSAVFAPLKNLGIIVVDEEHDTSYKQGESPRYHARDVAIMRAKLNDAICVLGSATPSVESLFNTSRGKSELLELKRRATNAMLPEVRIIDMRKVTKDSGANVILSDALERAVAERMANEDQVILLLNRRGFAPFQLCPTCGWIAECSDCNVTLTYHARGGYLLCHYCNTQHPVHQQCAGCGHDALQLLGHGTQKVEEYLQRTFPDARIERMDADTTAGKGGHAQILGRFADREIDILVGTQMIAKGHDYPGVTLVGVLNGDTGLGVCDFRAAENTFQLLTQVAGRAGRGEKSGEVIIQTFRPNHYAIRFAAQHDYLAFFEHEIEKRNEAGYPPFRRMANLMVEATDIQHAERAAMRLNKIIRDQIAELGADGMKVMGPAPATIHRVQKRYRWNIALLSKSSKRINAVTRAARQTFDEQRLPGNPALKVDLDPYGMS